MNYLEVLMLIEERSEKTLNQDSTSLITDKHRYLRRGCVWSEDPEPGMPMEKYTKGGKVFIWSQTKQPFVVG